MPVIRGHRGPLLLRAFHGPAVLAAAAAFLTVNWHGGPLAVPGRGIEAVIWPLSPVLLAIATVRCVPLFLGPYVVRSPRRIGVVVGFVVSWCAMVALLAGATTFAGHGGSSLAILGRNAAFAAGIVWLAPASNPDAGALALALISMTSWILGAPPMGQPPASWALLLHPADHPLATMVGVVTFAAGLLRLLAPARWPR